MTEKCECCGVDMGEWDEISDIEICHMCDAVPLCENCAHVLADIDQALAEIAGPHVTTVCTMCLNELKKKKETVHE